MHALAKVPLVAAVLLYPFWAHYGLEHWGVAPVALALAALALARAALLRDALSACAGACALLLALWGVLADTESPLLFYPVLVNAAGLWLFSASLSGTPVVEKFARMRTPELPETGVRWCRGVTKLWCAFFAVNGALAAVTAALGDLALWRLYNGLISYLAMGALFAGEWLARQWRLKGRAP